MDSTKSQAIPIGVADLAPVARTGRGLEGREFRGGR
jgi:hypothetical protein